MALLKKGLTLTVWALGGLVAFFFGLVGASPPAWAESKVEIRIVPPSPAPPRVEMPSERMKGEVIPKLEPPGRKVGEVIPKLDPASAARGPSEWKQEGQPGELFEKSSPKLETLPGEPFGTAIPKLETPAGESEGKGSVKHKVVDSEAQGTAIPELETPAGESEGKGYMKFDGVDGE